MLITPFEPGRSPCGGLCSYDWAVQAAGVVQGLPYPISLPEGTLITWMSYGKGGQPVGGPAAMVTVQPHEVVGYQLPDGSYFVQFWECGNWSIVRPVTVAQSTAPEVVQHAYSFNTVTPVSVWTTSTTVPGVVEELPPTAVIPLPPSAWLLLAALGCLVAYRSRHAR